MSTSAQAGEDNRNSTILCSPRLRSPLFMMPKVITIAQQKGGAGKTTVAAHLSVALAQLGLRVGVVDIDPQGTLSQWYNAREERLGVGNTGLTFRTVSGWRAGSEILRLKEAHDIILVDSPPHTETEARTAIRSADLVVVPVQPSPADVWATAATVEIARHEKVPVQLVLNRVPPNSRMAALVAEALPELAQAQLGNRVIFSACFLDGLTAQEMQPSSPAAAEAHALADELLTRMGITAPSTGSKKKKRA
jgi:chromosome partitioning protein